MAADARWITTSDVAEARQRLIDAIPGWRPPAAHAIAFVPGNATGIGPEHFPLVNTAEHLLPAAVLATVLGHSSGTAVYELSPRQLHEAIALLEPAEACTAYDHPNLERWRDDVEPAWQQDPRARVLAVFLGVGSADTDGHPAVVALRAAIEGRQLTLREQLRALPVFGAPLPRFDVDEVPEDPRTLFTQWLHEAMSDGVRIPHSATLSTADPAGDVSARTLILKDVDERGWWFASRTDGRKHRDLAANPRAAMTFFWREHGRQVRLSGGVMDAGGPAADTDFRARPAHSRAAAVIGVQSTPLRSRADYAAAFDAAKAEMAAHPDHTSATWAALILQPLVVEFWATTPDAGQIRLEYRRDDVGGAWHHGLLWP